MQNNRIIIISMTCGEGHNAVSKALLEKFKEEGFEGKIEQLYSYDEKEVINKNNLYLNACKYFKYLYDFLWKIENDRDPEKKEKLYLHKTLKKPIMSLKKVIEEYKPSVVISTHPYANVAVNDLVKQNLIDKNIKTISILTDYCVHPYWEAGTLLNYVVVPSQNVVKDLIFKGYNQDQIKVIGYPIANKFQNIIDKEKARKELGIDNKFTIMILNGGNGLGNNLNLIKNILKTKRDFQILCVCGKNVKGKAQLENYIQKHNIKNIIVYGFIDNINVLMCASDCIFSRGGGVSLTEALYLNVPIIIREKMFINEQINKEFFISNNAAVGMNKISDAENIITSFIDDKSIIEKIKMGQNKIVNRNATKDIVNFITKLIK